MSEVYELREKEERESGRKGKMRVAIFRDGTERKVIFFFSAMSAICHSAILPCLPFCHLPFWHLPSAILPSAIIFSPEIIMGSLKKNHTTFVGVIFHPATFKASFLFLSFLRKRGRERMAEMAENK